MRPSRTRKIAVQAAVHWRRWPGSPRRPRRAYPCRGNGRRRARRRRSIRGSRRAGPGTPRERRRRAGICSTCLTRRRSWLARRARRCRRGAGVRWVSRCSSMEQPAVSMSDAGWCGDGRGLLSRLVEGVGDGVSEAEGRAGARCGVPGLGAVARPGGGEERVADAHIDGVFRFARSGASRRRRRAARRGRGRRGARRSRRARGVPRRRRAARRARAPARAPRETRRPRLPCRR